MGKSASNDAFVWFFFRPRSGMVLCSQAKGHCSEQAYFPVLKCRCELTHRCHSRTGFQTPSSHAFGNALGGKKWKERNAVPSKLISSLVTFPKRTAGKEMNTKMTLILRFCDQFISSSSCVRWNGLVPGVKLPMISEVSLLVEQFDFFICWNGSAFALIYSSSVVMNVQLLFLEKIGNLFDNAKFWLLCKSRCIKVHLFGKHYQPSQAYIKTKWIGDGLHVLGFWAAHFCKPSGLFEWHNRHSLLLSSSSVSALQRRGSSNCMCNGDMPIWFGATNCVLPKQPTGRCARKVKHFSLGFYRLWGNHSATLSNPARCHSEAVLWLATLQRGWRRGTQIATHDWRTEAGAG